MKNVGYEVQQELKFGPNRKHGIARRIAKYLDWAAKHKPNEFIPYSRIAQAVLELFTPPKDRSDLSKRIAEFTYKARPILANEYGRDLATNGDGARATTGSTDALLWGLSRDIKRINTLMRVAARSEKVIQQAGLDRKQFPHLAAWLDGCGLELRKAALPLFTLKHTMPDAARRDLDRMMRLAAERGKEVVPKAA